MPALPREHKKVALCRLMPDDEQSDSMIAACSAISKAAASVHAACYPDQGTTDRGEDADTATGAVKLGKLGSLVELGHHTYHAPPGAAVVTDFDGFLSKSATAMMDTLHAQVNQYMPVQQPATFTGPPDQAQADPTWGSGGVFGHSLYRNHGFGSTNVGPGTGAGGEEHPGSVNFNSIMKMGAQSCSAEQTWWEKASADSTLPTAQPLPTQPKQIQPQSMIGSPDDTQQMLASSMGAVAGPASAYSALIGD